MFADYPEPLTQRLKINVEYEQLALAAGISVGVVAEGAKKARHFDEP